jgi:hypothetical protein
MEWLPSRISPEEYDKLVRFVRVGYVRDDRLINRTIDGDTAEPVVSCILTCLHELGLIDIRDVHKALGGGELIAPGKRDWVPDGFVKVEGLR